MTPDQVLDYFGSQEKVAEALGISQGAISQWKSNYDRRGLPIPFLRQLQIEALTRRHLRADPLPLPTRKATAA